ncbi:hypothetical protein ACPOLB_25400 [Rubrivivax sp. RP6-9]|uniref:hypothetical protein n=1 Tax=Rubrivivax sp. RP6-9 TaxID=3415750 RepID=UPI003CC6165D
MPMPVRSVWRPAVAAAALILVTTLVACGGGGGGGGDTRSGVEFSALAASTTRFDVPEGGSTPDIALSAQISGNLAELDGKTLYVRIDDGLGLFEPAARIDYNASTRQASVALTGRQQTLTGLRSGRLGVRVCLDVACQNALTPPGYGIDMSVNVRAGLRTTPSELLVRVPFGTLPPTSLVRVVVPEGRTPSEFSAGIVAGADGTAFDLSRDLTPGSEGIRVAPRLLPVGRYQSRLEVVATSADTGFGAQSYVQESSLVLEVEPSDVDFAVLPSVLDFTVDYGTQRLQPFTVGAVAQTGSFRLDPVVYDHGEEPPGTAYPLRGAWLRTAGEAWSVVVCEGTSCLPRGVHRATLPFVRLTAAGFPTGQVVEVPVTLTVR